ncbi:MAG: hypothetical protein SFV21_02050 [Rhodospirillaceae bacterium]|nr:hypothetical protein [Rhodospirillaceae bacterium]
MEIFRYSRNAWGQTTLEGMSFELFWVFLGAAVAAVAIHAVVMAFKGGGKRSG